MNNWRMFLLMFFIILLFPIVFGEEFKQVKQMDLPACFGNITFKIVGVEPYTINDVKIEGCDNIQNCACTNQPQIINFLTLDTISNTFDITIEFYIAPLIEYNSDPNVMYNPNEDNKRNLKFSNIKVISELVEDDNNKTSVSTLSIFIILLILLIVLGVLFFFIMRYLKGEDKKKVKGGDKKKEITKIVSNNNDIQNYLSKLEKERRQ